ncbi:MAG: EFR1 family ferrodoxin [Anaerolineae bacterium]|nr:EFR1 family ferrodoxin [Anaerolineae bacterium]
MQIYYFSGTGNSLHVARELTKRFPDATLVPMLSVLRDDRIASTAETVGLVFPIHNLTLPLLVRRFLQQADFKSATYMFAISTRLCSDKVFSDIDKLLAKQGKSLDATFSVEMPCTYTPLFKSPSQEELARMEAELQKRIDTIQTVIVNRQTSREKDDPLVFFLGHILYPVITAYMQNVRFPGMIRSFYADSKCTGCGVCEKVCLTGRIHMKDNRPEWSNRIDCAYCFACLHYCPVQAIQIRGRSTIAKGRYHHPEITVADITRQKHEEGKE